MAAFVVLWLTMGLVAGTIAGNRGLSPIAYFFLGMLIGPIGIVVAAVARPPGSHLPPPGGPPPGWYPDPSGLETDRYWDGYRWTERVPGVEPTESSRPPSPALQQERPRGAFRWEALEQRVRQWPLPMKLVVLLVVPVTVIWLRVLF